MGKRSSSSDGTSRSQVDLGTAAMNFKPLVAERWRDLEELFGERGACGGCWCMWWRQSRAESMRNKGEKNRRAFRKLVKSGRVPGLLAYAGKRPVGWCAIEPRENYPVIENSRALKRVDEQPVWSVVCFFVLAKWRGKGVGAQLLNAAARWAKKNGAKILEGYPVQFKMKRAPAAFVWTGVPALFDRAGFRKVARPSASRVIMRRELR